MCILVVVRNISDGSSRKFFCIELIEDEIGIGQIELVHQKAAVVDAKHIALALWQAELIYADSNGVVEEDCVKVAVSFEVHSKPDMMCGTWHGVAETFLSESRQGGF